VLSSAKIGRSSWRYYQATVAGGACEYYSEHGGTPGRWHGAGLAPLGLVAGGEVQEWELEALFARAISPTTGEQLGAGWRDGSVTGYDLTFSAPKSVSTLWAIGDPAMVRAIEAGHGAAVRAALGYLEQVASWSRRGRNGIEQIGSGGYGAAVFDHGTSRTGDPQLHTHCLVVNKVRCVDGAWRTLDGREVYHHKKAAGALYQAALRAELTARLQVRFGPVSEHGQAEITGIPTEFMTFWSKRTTAVMADAAPTIAETEADLGRVLSPAERARVVKTAVLATRPPKPQHASGARRVVWAAEASTAGWDRHRLTEAVSTAATVDAPASSPTSVSRSVVADGADGGVIAVSTGGDDASRADPVRNDVIGAGSTRGVQVPDDANLRPVPDRVRLLADAVTAVGRTKAVWSRADLTVALAARIDTLTEPLPATAIGVTALVGQLTNTALAPQPTTAAATPMTETMTPTAAPMTRAAPTEPAAASSVSAFASPATPSGSAAAVLPTGDRDGLSMPPSGSPAAAVDVGVVGLGPVRCGNTARASDARYASQELVDTEARIIERAVTGSVRRPRPLPAALAELAVTGPGGFACPRSSNAPCCCWPRRRI
jgi:conjugative relaxase-like TrwC/TraI family protein